MMLYESIISAYRRQCAADARCTGSAFEQEAFPLIKNPDAARNARAHGRTGARARGRTGARAHGRTGARAHGRTHKAETKKAYKTHTREQACTPPICATRLLGSLREMHTWRESSGEGSYGAIAGVELEASRYDKYTARGHKRSPDPAGRANGAETSREDPLGATTQPLGSYSVTRRAEYSFQALLEE